MLLQEPQIISYNMIKENLKRQTRVEYNANLCHYLHSGMQAMGEDEGRSEERQVKTIQMKLYVALQSGQFCKRLRKIAKRDN